MLAAYGRRNALLAAFLAALAIIQTVRAEDGLPAGYTCAKIRALKAQAPPGTSEKKIDDYVTGVLGYSKVELAAARRCLTRRPVDDLRQTRMAE